MMKKYLKFFYLIILILSTGKVWALAQAMDNDNEFEFYQQLDNANEVEIVESFIQDNYLGHEIAKKMYILEELYTYEEEGTATSPGVKTVVEKPSIYYAIKKLNRYYKKMVKKDRVPLDQAKDNFEHILNIGISIIYQRTASFEEYLDDHRKPEELLEAFSSVDLQD
ncbi:MAG: hypothetical protein ACNS62_05060 [Candidatus Cyclobacteriaceae bacterium M3_2C_046]